MGDFYGIFLMPFALIGFIYGIHADSSIEKLTARVESLEKKIKELKKSS